MNDHNAPPLNPLPVIVWILVLPMIAMEIVLSAGAAGIIGGPEAVGWRVQAFQRFAFAPDFLRQMIEARQYPLDGMMRLVTYPFVHGSLTHALFVGVILLALGKFVGEVFRWWALVVVFFGASIAGALAYTAVPVTHVALIGGYPAAYGLIGAFTFLLWVRLAGKGVSQFRAFTLIGFLLGVQMIFGIVAQVLYGPAAGVGWDWVADLAGFAAGFVLSFAVSPGGWQRVLDRIRRR